MSRDLSAYNVGVDVAAYNDATVHARTAPRSAAELRETYDEAILRADRITDDERQSIHAAYAQKFAHYLIDPDAQTYKNSRRRVTQPASGRRHKR